MKSEGQRIEGGYNNRQGWAALPVLMFCLRYYSYPTATGAEISTVLAGVQFFISTGTSVSLPAI